MVESAETVQDRAWNLPSKVAFRIAFVYFSLYLFPFPFDHIPGLALVSVPWNIVIMPFINWVSMAYFHLPPDSSHFNNGSGDQQLRYIELAAYLGLALWAALIWSLRDRKRKNYARLFTFLRLWALLFVSANMLTYGGCKVIPTQFPPVSEATLVERVGDLSPMGILWTFMGASQPYVVFTGSAELFAGLLLAIPPTATLGALVAAAVSLHIFMLNMCYDVPVKILSSHLLLLSILYLVPDISNLVDFFVLRKATQPLPLPKLFRKRRLNLTVQIFSWIFLAYILFGSLYSSYYMSRPGYSRGNAAVKFGLWKVESAQMRNFEKNDGTFQPIPWQFVSNVYGEYIVVTTTNKQRYFRWKFSADGKTVDITKNDDQEWHAHFDVNAPDANTLNLVGKMNGEDTEIKMSRYPRSNFLLINRGFHWVNEYPFNR